MKACEVWSSYPVSELDFRPPFGRNTAENSRWPSRWLSENGTISAKDVYGRLPHDVQVPKPVSFSRDLAGVGRNKAGKSFGQGAFPRWLASVHGREVAGPRRRWLRQLLVRAERRVETAGWWSALLLSLQWVSAVKKKEEKKMKYM